MGRRGWEWEVLVEWGNRMVNMEMMVIGWLEDVFMGMWGRGDKMRNVGEV